MEQKHLNYKDTINYGSYYTPVWIVDIVYEFLSKHIISFNEYFIVDTSCGYGAFLRGEKAIGADIDELALGTAKKNNPRFTYFKQNSLLNISRLQYMLSNDDKIIIVGNPPYNDTTSIIRNEIKQEIFPKDNDVASRDLGISFLLSYNKIKANYICVLHPLSYLIKKTNFENLGDFKKNYKLIDALIISSGVFSETSKTTYFPIIIAFYERNLSGMNYDYICNYKFKTYEGKTFYLKQYDKISNYITKYPNQKYINKDETIAYFWTMRDINALKRTKTFVRDESYNTIRVTKNNLLYYCYVDIFKDYIPHIPYYFGNSDIMIINDSFLRIKDFFIKKSIKKNPELCKYISCQDDFTYRDDIIEKYFKNLLGEHYVD